MDNLELILNESEKRTRKRWLNLLLVLAAGIGFLSFFSLLEMINADKIRSTAEVWAGFCVAIVGLCKFLLPFYLIYHCAYKKAGTRYLTFTLIVGPLAMITETYLELGNAMKESDHIVGGCMIAWIMLVFIVEVWWQILGWKLRAVNKKIQRARKGAITALVQPAVC